MAKGVVGGLDDVPTGRADRAVRETQHVVASLPQSATGRAGESVGISATREAGADSQAFLERRLAEARRESERELGRLQAALDRCKAGRERSESHG